MSIYQKLLIIFFIGLMNTPLVYANDNKKLESLRRSIVEQEKRLAQQTKKRTQLINDLKDQETEIANLLTSIEKKGLTLKKLAKEIASLIKQIDELTIKQQQQQDELSRQLESAFKLGKNKIGRAHV